MKKVIIIGVVSLLVGAQCASPSKEEIDSKEVVLPETDSSAVAIDTVMLKPVMNVKDLVNCIDSSATANGGALLCLIANKEFLSTINPYDITVIYHTYWEAMNAYLDNNLPYIDEKYLDANYQVDAKFSKSLSDKGFYVETDGEGGYFPMVDRTVLFNIFDGLGDEALQNYLGFFKNQRDFIAFDGGLSLTPIEIAQRIVFFDTHFEKYPQFVLREELRMFYEREMYFIMFGLDNSPAYDYEKKTYSIEHKAALEFLMKNATKFTQGVIKKYYNALDKNAWQMLEEGYEKYYFGIGSVRK
jgi:hypothetical protein